MENQKSEIKAYAYVDGSYNIHTSTYGYGGILKANGEEYVLQGCSDDPERASMRNVAGEIDGCMAAVKKALDLKLESLTIYYDYQGIEAWATRQWKCKNKWTSAYRAFMDEASQNINIEFVKVKGHTGVDGNERADRIAKEAVGIA